MDKDSCKICGGRRLKTFAHTARCLDCGVLLYWPYPNEDGEEIAANTAAWTQESVLDWYARASFLNHDNFTRMVKFATRSFKQGEKIKVLDYGGGGGQFALVFKSLFPRATVYITDISDASLLDDYRSLNIQIPFHAFEQDTTQFDIIFLNDVYEHLSDPILVLQRLGRKLRPGGRIFVDTPKQFWLYGLTKILSRSLYTKVLRGTVSAAHLQIWSKQSFQRATQAAGLHIRKYEELSEYTMSPSYYLNNMDVRNPLLRAAGATFYRFAPLIARNKIACLLSA